MSMNGAGESSNRSSSNSNSVLLDSLLDSHREGAGILCNDTQGLCVASHGEPVVCHPEANSGALTSLVRLASQTTAATSSSTAPPPLITIETDDSCILIKEYDGHTVALKVPSASAAADGCGPSDTKADGEQSDRASSDDDGQSSEPS